MAAYKAFLNPDPQTGGASFAGGRLSRYDRYWGLWLNTAYDQLTTYLRSYPENHRLYKKTRGLRNPLGQYADFWQANVWGGPLSTTEQDTALPIETENEALLPAIYQVWQWSNWAQKRNVATLHAAVLGDAFLVVVDSVGSGKVYLEARWPGDFKDLSWDAFGNVKRAEIEYNMVDDRGGTYTYRMVIEHPSEHGSSAWTRFTTYRNNIPFAYPENTVDGVAVATWEAPYDFVPVVHIPFQDVGMGWGKVGFHGSQRVIDEACAKASLINDQIAKMVNPPLVAAGIPGGNLTVTLNDDGIPIIFTNRRPDEASVTPLVYEMNIADAVDSLDRDLAILREQMPELQLMLDLRSGMSGTALQQAYSPLIAKVNSVRDSFDAGLVRAQQMAVAIGGIRGYAAVFAGYDLASYAAGALNHRIGPRPVLPRSQAERWAEEKAMWDVVGAATAAGVPLETALREVAGWTDEQLREMGTARMAAIALEQEDRIPGETQ